MDAIRDRWESFAAAVFDGVDAPAIQRQEMRRAFYGGCAALLDLVVQTADLDEESACRKLDRLSAELKEFFTALAQGKA